MARRKEFQGIATDLASKLSSRNNDYLGYWAVGQLCTLALKCKVQSIDIKINDNVESADIALVNHLRLLCCEFIADKMKVRRMPVAWLKNARFTVEFTNNHEKNYLYWGEPQQMYRFTIYITSDLDRVFSSSSMGYCVSHNSKKEYRRVE